MPTLVQVQDYINNRRRKICDENNLDDFKEYVKTLKYQEGVTADHEMFVFGANLGTGNDGDHFQIGLTIKTMLSRVELNGMFHLDATYQIVKYNFPLIIFGVTDITRNYCLEILHLFISCICLVFK
jgi:hypothetical protein